MGKVNFPLPAVYDDYGYWASWATLTGQTTKVILTPNDSDYVAYKMWVEESPPELCKIPEDANFPEYTKAFNDLQIRRLMEDYLARSNANAPDAAQRHEEYGYVRKNADGTYRLDPAGHQVIDQCQSRVVVPDDPTILAVFHTHPFSNNEQMLCPTDPTEAYKGRLNNGGGEPDWAHNIFTNNHRRSIGLNQVPYYILDKDYAYYNYPGGIPFDLANKAVYRSGGANCKWVY